MGGCRCPFSIRSLWLLEIDDPPACTVEDNGGNARIVLTFPQAMDQASTPALGDFACDGVIVTGELTGVSWTSSTVLKITTSENYPPGGTSELDYTKGVNLIKTALGEEYASWIDLEVPAF